jgi:hypothetical protein
MINQITCLSYVFLPPVVVEDALRTVPLETVFLVAAYSLNLPPPKWMRNLTP